MLISICKRWLVGEGVCAGGPPPHPPSPHPHTQPPHPHPAGRGAAHQPPQAHPLPLPPVGAPGRGRGRGSGDPAPVPAIPATGTPPAPLPPCHTIPNGGAGRAPAGRIGARDVMLQSYFNPPGVLAFRPQPGTVLRTPPPAERGAQRKGQRCRTNPPPPPPPPAR